VKAKPKVRVPIPIVGSKIDSTCIGFLMHGVQWNLLIDMYSWDPNDNPVISRLRTSTLAYWGIQYYDQQEHIRILGMRKLCIKDARVLKPGLDNLIRDNYRKIRTDDKQVKHAITSLFVQPYSKMPAWTSISIDTQDTQKRQHYATLLSYALKRR